MVAWSQNRVFLDEARERRGGKGRKLELLGRWWREGKLGDGAGIDKGRGAGTRLPAQVKYDGPMIMTAKR